MPRSRLAETALNERRPVRVRQGGPLRAVLASARLARARPPAVPSLAASRGHGAASDGAASDGQPQRAAVQLRLAEAAASDCSASSRGAQPITVQTSSRMMLHVRRKELSDRGACKGRPVLRMGPGLQETACAPHGAGPARDGLCSACRRPGSCSCVLCAAMPRGGGPGSGFEPGPQRPGRAG